MAEYDSIAQFRRELDLAIDIAMQDKITDEAKKALAETAEKNVYEAYPDPLFESRYGEDGGILDTHYMIDHYDSHTKTLEITQNTPWQHLGRRSENYPMTNLNEVIQKNRIYHAPKRPYMSEAERTYGKNQFEKDLIEALNDLGF